MSESRQLHQHQRSSSTGSHGLFFSTVSHPLSHGVNSMHHQTGPHHKGHHVLHHQASGSPDLLSDLSDDEESNESCSAPELQGTLSKWTNYIHGWQYRYIALKEGSLVYYKSEVETDFGCRGAISIDKAMVKPHELDDLRFDISVSECVWYLRANTVEDRQKWIDTIEAHKKFILEFSHLDGSRDCNPPNAKLLNSLRHHDSSLSLTSNASKGAFGGSCNGGQFNRGSSAYRGLTEKLAEMETYRDILCKQIETLQSYFDACSDVAQNHQHSPMHRNCVNEATGTPTDQDDEKMSNGFHENIGSNPVSRNNSSDAGTEGHIPPYLPVTKDLVLQHGIHAVDFKGEAITFKATTAGILATLAHCIEIMTQREEQWKRKLEREQLARRRLEERLKCRPEPTQTNVVLSNQNKSQPDESKVSITPSKPKNIPKIVGGPDYEEGPLSQIGEDEFFDAVESALDKLQEEQDYKDKLKKMSKIVLPEEISPATNHQLWPTINQVTNEQLGYARMEVGDVWELFAEDGQMKMYKREEEVDGMVMDPLKALHEVRGVTARELCHYFFVPEVRMEWETTVEEVTVLEKIAPDTLIFLQLHKRVWPAAQRDALFWSHMRHLGSDSSLDNKDHLQTDTWMVCNKSAKHPDAPENQGGCLRVGLTVCFVCDTFIDKGYTKETATRNNISTKITYCSVVNPGGWAPASVLRTVFKREYPRFLKRFTQYVIDKSKDKALYW